MITSTSNPLIKRIRRLRQKKYRRKDGSFFVEGLRVFISAVEAQAPLQTILYSPELLTSELALKILADQRNVGFECVETTAHVFRSISTREHPVGLGAVVSTDWTPIELLPVSQSGLFVSLLNVSEPGNLGTIIRTVDAVGADALILAGNCVDPFHQTAVKASMGSLFHVPISEVANIQDLLFWARDQEIHTVATSARAPQSFWDLSYELPLIIMLGSEGEGLPVAVLDEADQSISVPMKGTASSLNLAVAAGLILYEVMRQN